MEQLYGISRDTTDDRPFHPGFQTHAAHGLNYHGTNHHPVSSLPVQDQHFLYEPVQGFGEFFDLYGPAIAASPAQRNSNINVDDLGEFSGGLELYEEHPNGNVDNENQDVSIGELGLVEELPPDVGQPAVDLGEFSGGLGLFEELLNGSVDNEGQGVSIGELGLAEELLPDVRQPTVDLESHDDVNGDRARDAADASGGAPRDFNCANRCKGNFIGPHECFKSRYGRSVIISCLGSIGNGKCPKTFRNRNDFNRHCLDRHGNVARADAQNANGVMALIDCTFPNCNRVGRRGFKRKDNLTQHRRSVHGEGIPKMKARFGPDGVLVRVAQPNGAGPA